MANYTKEIIALILVIIAFALPNNDLPIKKKRTNWYDNDNNAI